MIFVIMLLVNVLESYVPHQNINLTYHSKIEYPDNSKMGEVSPVYKCGDNSSLSSYWPISVLPCFSKMFERIMYTRLYNYLQENKTHHSKQFDFQTRHSADHAIIQLVDQIHENFE